MSGLFSIDRAIVESVGWTLVHFLWQGALVALALALLNGLMAKCRPQLRYVAGCAALLVMFAMPIATFVVIDAVTDARGARSMRVSDRALGAPAWLDRAVRSSSAAAMSAKAAAPVARELSRARARVASSETLRATLRDLRHRVADTRFLPWFVAAWMTGVVLFSLRLLGGFWLVTRLGRAPGNVPIEAWEATLARLARQMGVTRPVRLVRSALVSVPTALGWFRPVIMLPASTLTGLSAAQIEAILAHELAHIRRHDYAINLLQSVIETLLFYHPAVWWVSRRIREERELCCDDLAVRAMGDPVTYARALCELEKLRGTEVRLALAASGGSLVTRIARLLGASRGSQLEASRAFAWALIVSLIVIAGAAGGAVRVDTHVANATTTARDVMARTTPRVIAHAAKMAAKAAEAAKESVAPVMALEGLASLSNVEVTAIAEASALVNSSEFAQAIESALHAASAASKALEAVSVASEVACETKERDATNAEEAEEAESLLDAYDEAKSTRRVVVRSSSDFSPEEWQKLTSSGVSARYIDNLARAGYPDLSVEEYVKLAQHGVSSTYAGAIHRLIEPSVDDLVKLAQNGVSSRYVRGMHRELETTDVNDLIRLANNGVTSEYVAGMREHGLEDLSIDDLIRLASNGVTLKWFSSLRWMGYDDVSVERAIQLRNSGVTPDYAASLRRVSGQQLSLDDLKTLRNQGVEVEYAATMLGMLRKDLSVSDLVRLRQQGVSVEYVAALNALGYPEIEADDLVTLRQQGVEPEFIAEMAGAGYEGLDTAELVKLRQNGVNADFIARVREAGLGTPDVSALIQMRQRGIPHP